MMTSKERILAAVNHQSVDRIPTDIYATLEVQEKLFDHFIFLLVKSRKRTLSVYWQGTYLEVWRHCFLLLLNLKYRLILLKELGSGDF